ncbi:hypothetical protein FNV43_RR26523 [Rhamnella rubrinervis]|uniref:Probable sodium/metabolite cotransporter BASS4, chloroplastic n=1 Tax=Rhamnella rubrinervis TaxID=2594499 RepID=A0A8K0GJQ2_9ROSA|nr:hypothetical protein FNV43_RR26523 [Rhamnella rubrinervis]
MAGTIHTLILTPPPAKTLPFRFPDSRFRPVQAFYRSGSSNSHCSRSISRPIRACESSNQKEGNEEKGGQVLGLTERLAWSKPLLNFASNNFLPLALMSGVAVGLANPTIGCLADKYSLSKFSTFGIFIISGLTLRSGDISAAAEAWPVGISGLVSILFFTPFFSRIILQLQLQPQEFVIGLAIFCCMPTTLSSGVALTQLAGGNSALALAMTVFSNLLGILIVPFSISKFVANGVGASVPAKQLFKSLVVSLLIPLILGKVFRESFKGLADFVDQNRKLFSKISAVCLSLVPWIQVSRSRSLLVMVNPATFLVAVGIGALIHIIFVAFNVLGVKSLSALSGGGQSVFAKKENSSALVLVASQKTLPVMVAVVEQLGGALGESGLLVLPCIAAHIIQIILDSFLVDFWLRKDISSNNAKVA